MFAVKQFASVEDWPTLGSLLRRDAGIISRKGRERWALMSGLKQWRADSKVSSVKATDGWLEDEMRQAGDPDEEDSHAGDTHTEGDDRRQNGVFGRVSLR